MPYEIRMSGNQFCVHKQGTGERLGCHSTKEKAMAQMRALYANEPRAKAEWDAAYINDLPDSAFAVILAGGEKDDEGKTVPRSLRKLPHHAASGDVDMPHLRNAMSREPQADMAAAMHERAHAHLMRHAEAEDMGAKSLQPLRAKAMADDEFAAWFDGRLPRRLLAIPFYGPIPGPDGIGRDLDGEYFDEATDIYGPYPGLRKSRERLTDFMHSYAAPDPRYGDDTGMMTGALIGKSILDPDPDEDGWWVDLWLERGNKRVALIKRLAERGGQLYGSSQHIGKASREPDGRITVWPYWLQTISTVVQNTASVIRPKAVLLGIERLLESEDNRWSDIEAALRSLAPSLRVPPSQAELEAKAGRVLSATNESDLRDALDALRSGLDRLETVVRRQPDYSLERGT